MDRPILFRLCVRINKPIYLKSTTTKNNNKNKSIKRAPIYSICLSCIVVRLCFHQSLMQPTKHNNNRKISKIYFEKHTYENREHIICCAYKI